MSTGAMPCTAMKSPSLMTDFHFLGGGDFFVPNRFFSLCNSFFGRISYARNKTWRH